MEAWRQYRAFTAPASTHVNVLERKVGGRSTVFSPSLTAETLNDPPPPFSTTEKTAPQGKNDPSLSPKTLEPVPASTSEEEGSGTPTSATATRPPPAPKEPTYVSFDPSDPADPQNWSFAFKSWVVSLLSFLTLSLTYASSASSSAKAGVMEEFGCGEVAATATTGIFLVGMGMGAMPAAPLSECAYPICKR